MFKKIIVLIGILVVSGCVSAGALNKEETVEPSMINIQSLSALQINRLLVGHTYPLSNGEIYFSSPSTATLILSGEIGHVNWHATDGSSFCYTLNNKNHCLGIAKNDNGNYVQDENGVKKIITSEQIVKGKKFFNYYR